MTKKIRTAIIGLGKMGILHSALINTIPQAELVAVCDTNRKLAKYVEKTGLEVSFYSALDQLLDEASPQAVFVCTPPFTHLPLSEKCIERHCDIFAEKPLAESFSSAQKMVALAEKKGIMLLSPVDDEVYAYGDRDMINSVIRNLMTNAVKFTPHDKKVEVRVEATENNLEVSIVDEGIGIPEEHLGKLFRSDEKFKSTGTDGEKGTGLGLIICREFVEKNGGQIRVRSKAGKGSTFSFTLPPAN